MKDEFKKKIKGWRGHGHVCSCCKETNKKSATRMARRRLKQDDEKELVQMDGMWIEYERAHLLADAACLRGDFQEALDVLRCAQKVKGGPTGVCVDIRTANRILNLKDSVGELKPARKAAVTLPVVVQKEG